MTLLRKRISHSQRTDLFIGLQQQGGGMGMPGLMGGMGNVPGGMNMGMAGGRPPAFAGGMASMPEVEKMLRGNQENMGGNQGQNT